MWFIALIGGFLVGWLVGTVKTATKAGQALLDSQRRETEARKEESEIRTRWETFNSELRDAKASAIKFAQTAGGLWQEAARCAVNAVASGDEPLTATLMSSHRRIVERFCSYDWQPDIPEPDEIVALRAMERTLREAGYQPMAQVFTEMSGELTRTQAEFVEVWKKANEAVALQRNRAFALQTVQAATDRVLELKAAMDDRKYLERMRGFWATNDALWPRIKCWVDDLDEVRKIGRLRRDSAASA